MPDKKPGLSRRRLRPRHGLTSIQFRDLVARALDSVPEPFAGALDDVAVVVEDAPSPQQRRELGLGPGDDVYGVFEGVSRTEWASDWAVIPNKITLFRIALEEDFEDHAELEHEVRVTVLHELGHYLGIDESRLHELGVD
jgi:predicted Zn-dependent protease with MMP-like domain